MKLRENIKLYITLFALGSFSVLSFEPIKFYLAMPLAIALLLFLSGKAENIKESFIRSLIFGFGHFLAGLYWISIATTVDGGGFLWAAPIVVTLLPLVLAIYIAIPSIITYYFFSSRNSVGRVVFFSLNWTGFELIRTVFIFGFPWNLAGYAIASNINMMQITSVIGIYGLGFFTILASSSLLLLRRNYFYAIAFIFPLVIFYCYGSYRLSNYDQLLNHNQITGKVRLVQANIPQALKLSREQKFQAIDEYSTMSLIDIDKSGVKYVIWPETAVASFMDDNVAQILSRAAPPAGLLIAGAMRTEFDNEGAAIHIWNSMFAINHDGKIVASYDKNKLVPFGEYVPLTSLLVSAGIIKRVFGFDGGNSHNNLNLRLYGLGDIAPLICYEIIFTRALPSNTNAIINLTNDAWFGQSSGPYQHYLAARVRAVEYGVPVIRSANTGISAIIDSFGKGIAVIDLDHKGYVDHEIPSTISEGTIYMKIRSYLLYFYICMYLLLLFLLLRKKMSVSTCN